MATPSSSRAKDCDTFEDRPGAERCNPPGSADQCRYSCAPGPGSDLRSQCPDGWGCGSDDVCRRHSGQLDEQLVTGQPIGRWFDVGDFDGDRHLDIVSVSDALVSVDYLESGLYRQSHRFPLEAEGAPSITDADEDGLADLLSPTLGGVSLLRGSSTRTLLPTTFTSLVLPVDEAFAYVSAELAPTVVEITPGVFGRYPGEETFAITDAGVAGLSTLLPYAPEVGLPGQSAVAIDGAALEGLPIVAAFDEVTDIHGAYRESPEQVVVVTATEVTLFRPSTTLLMGALHFYLEAPTEAPSAQVPAGHPSRTAVSLPAGHRANQAFALQGNLGSSDASTSRWPCGAGLAPADNHLDLAVATSDANGEPRLVMAFGLGDGTFHSDPCALDDVAADIIAADSALGTPSWLQACTEPTLAMGDVDGDGAPDVVTPRHTNLSAVIPAGAEGDLSLCDPFTRIVHPLDTRFGEAIITDLDGDGIGDIAAGSNEAGLDVLSAPNVGPELAHVTHVTSGPASALRVGDFDGDGLADVAFAERLDAEVVVRVLFGEQDAIGDTPRLVASLPNLTALATTSISIPTPEGPVSDAPDELVMVTAASNGSRAAVLQGRADRRLQAPFLYAVEEASYFPYGAAIAPFASTCDGAAPDDTNPQVLFVVGGVLQGEPDSPVGNIGSACVDDALQFTLGERAISDLGVVSREQARGSAIFPYAHQVGGDGAGPTQQITEPAVVLFNPLEGLREITMSLPTRAEGPNGPEWIMGGAATIPNATVAGADASGFAKPTSLIRAWSPNLNNVPQPCRLWPGSDAAIVFLAVHDDGTCPQDSGANGDPARNVIHALPAATVLALREAQLTGARTIDNAPDETTLGFACLNLDEDPQQELVLLTLIGPVAQCEEPAKTNFTAELRIAEVDAGGELVVRAAPLAELPASQLALANPRTPPASGLAAGDFNQDGVDDLLVATPNTGIIWLGKPVDP